MRGAKPSIVEDLEVGGDEAGERHAGPPCRRRIRAVHRHGYVVSGSRGKMGRRTRLKSKRVEVRRGQPGRVHLDDLAGDGLEGGAVVDGGLDHQDLVLEGIEADEAEHLRIERLPAVGDEDHLDVVHVEHRGGPEAAGQAADHGPLVDEAAVGQRAHRRRSRVSGAPWRASTLPPTSRVTLAPTPGLRARGAPRRGPRGRRPPPSARPRGAARGGSRCRRPPRRRRYCRPCRRA